MQRFLATVRCDGDWSDAHIDERALQRVTLPALQHTQPPCIFDTLRACIHSDEETINRRRDDSRHRPRALDCRLIPQPNPQQ